MIISAIAAVAENGVIGKDNTLVWKLSNDLKRFKEITSGHHIIMGRKNYEDIGRPLPNRTNIIITRQKDYVAEGCIVVNTLVDAIETAKANGESELFIIGGSQIYDLAWSYCTKLYITKVHKKFDGDVYFPHINHKWKEISNEGIFKSDNKNECDYSFLTYTLIS